MAKDLPLKHRLVLGGIAAVFIPFTLVAVIIYIQLSRSLLEMTKANSVRIANNVSVLIDATLSEEMKLAETIASDLDVIAAAKTEDYQIASLELTNIYGRVGKKFFTIFLADRQGIIREDPFFPQQIGLDISDREYFIGARKGAPCVGGPYFPRGKATPENPIVVISAPIEDHNEFYGIIAIAITTDFIVNVISQEKLGQTGYAFLMNSQGLILIHPKKEFILHLNLLDQPGSEELMKILMGGKRGAVDYTFDGVKMIVGIDHVQTTGWITAFTQSKSEIMVPVNRILLSIFISGIIFLLITIIIIVFFYSKVSNPIVKLMDMMKQVTYHSNEIILQVGLDRKITYANPAYERITGLRVEDILGTEPVLTNPHNIAPSEIWASLEAGIPWSGRVVLHGNYPDPITLDVMLVNFRDDRGGIQGYLEIARDITAETVFEKKLNQAQKLEAIGTLAGGIAHDFNNILNVIFGYSELILMKKDSIPDVENYISQILTASERARDLVGQILTFSRKTDFELRPLLPESVLKETLKLLRASIPSTINIETNMDCGSAVMAEPTQLHQVVMNLFTNAVHAIGGAAGTIKLELQDYFLDEDYARTHPDIKRGKHVLLRVSDTGRGIEPELLDRIFEPFFTTKSQGEGTGLGLSVVHGIVKSLGGIITAYSEVGKGTTFNILIPAIEMDDPPSYHPKESVTRGTEKVAVVDDETAIADSMRSILVNCGYTVTSFTDSVDALTAIKENPADFDVIVTDYSMPKLSGLDLISALKEAGISIPVILMSGYLGKTIEVAARDLGITELITKPVSTYQLTDAIHRVLGKNEN